MILRTPSYYGEFKCIAGECPDSCCQGWEVDADEASLRYYKTLNGELRKRIDSVLSKDEFSNDIFTLTGNKRCPFLNDENLCDIHIAVGGEHTPYTCRTFPRFINNFGSVREMGLSLSCPVACDMIYNLKQPMTFCEKVVDCLPELNDIDAQVYYYLVKSREKAFEIIYDRSKPVSERICELLNFAVTVQQEIEPYREGGDDIDFFTVFDNPELINPLWKEKVNSYEIKLVENNLSNENIAGYFIYRYFLTASCDLDVLSKAKMAAVGVLINTYFGGDSRTMQLWSKETEHSQYNMDRYKILLKTADCLKTENLIKRFRK